MPNWCSNTLTVSGPADTLKTAREAFAQPYGQDFGAYSGPLLLRNLAEPWANADEQAQYEKDKGAWYDLNIHHWGTKWEVEAEVTSETDDSVTFRFDSAWSPPIPAIITASTKWPDLTFHIDCDESGNDFSGEYTLKAGEMTDHREGPSRWHWCDICDESFYADWDEPVACPTVQNRDEAATSEDLFPYLGHLLAGDYGPQTVDQYVTTIHDLGHSVIYLIEQNDQLADVEQRAALLAALGPQTDTLAAHHLLAGLTDDKVEQLAQHPNPTVTETVLLGTVGHHLTK